MLFLRKEAGCLEPLLLPELPEGLNLTPRGSREIITTAPASSTSFEETHRELMDADELSNYNDHQGHYVELEVAA